MQIASLHTQHRVDHGYANSNVNRATAFTDLVNGNGLLTERIQLLRRPMRDISFAGAESIALGRGTKEAYANEVGKQIFLYTLPTEGGDTGERDRVLFQYPDNNEYVFIKAGALMEAARRGSRPVVERYYKAAGRFVGWMLINRKPIPEDLSLMLFARLMGRKIGWEAIKVYDADKYRMFSTCFSGTAQEIEAIGCAGLSSYAINYINENGDPLESWPRLSEERRNLLNDMTTNLVTSESEEEFQIFSQGIYDVIPQHIFECGITTKDLRLLIVGVRTVDANELVDSMVIEYPLTDTSREIVWLKDFIRSLNQEKLKAFVAFATGRRRPGPGGFRVDPIRVTRMPEEELSKDIWYRQHPDTPRVPPMSHTCFKKVDLPPYANEATLREKVSLALGESEFVML